MSSNTIRRAAADDIGPLTQRVRGREREHAAANPQALRETLIPKAIFAPAPTWRALVADTGVSRAGFAFYAPACSVFRAGPAMHVDAVYVRECYRRQGLARALIGLILAEC
jgi:GNAT superfamily N-acetyltransferase